MAVIPTTDILVNKNNLRETRVKTGTIDPAALKPGEALLKVAKFALTANNVTYAAFGERMQYWNFFPAEAGFGRVPVWGFGDVIASKAEGVKAGERVYGYFPMSSHLVIEAGKVSKSAFSDLAAHRQVLSPVYNQYRRVAEDPAYSSVREAEQMVFTIFGTSFLIDDMLADNEFYGAKRVVIGSASSKTGYALGYLLSLRRPAGPEVVGLTSAGNASFLSSIKAFDRVLPYTALRDLDPSVPTVFVDMAGDAGILAAVHGHFRDSLKFSLLVGATHWENGGTQDNLPGPKPQFFFAPAQMEKRAKDWGAAGFQARQGEAKSRFDAFIKPWYRTVEHKGTEATLSAFSAVLDGKLRPEEGHICSIGP